MRSIIKNITGILSLAIVGLLLLSGCKKYLDAKSDAKLTTPTTVKDLQALLDYTTYMNRNYPTALQVGSDESYVTDTRVTSMNPIEVKNTYLWMPNAYFNNAWNSLYRAVFYANTVLDYIDKVEGSESDLANVKGSALFFRAFNLHQCALVYCPAYSSTNASSPLGLALRKTSDFNAPSVRATIQQTYDQIVDDYKNAISLLKDQQTVIFRPTKAAAYAGLARTYLVMGKYAEAKEAATQYLQLRSELMDLNSFSPGQKILRDNVESIFFATAAGHVSLNPSQHIIDSNLIKLYEPGDLRLNFFYRKNADQTYDFIGGYEGSSPSQITFQGLATDEVYLIRAECFAREQNISAALSDLNTLLEKRYASPFTPVSAGSAAAILDRVLLERRKELVFRGMRWSDIKRLNTDPAYQQTMTRNVSGTMYSLPPNDNRYSLLIPEDAIRISGMLQNPR